LDSQFVERHPNLKPLGSAHPRALALPRGEKTHSTASHDASAGASEILSVDTISSEGFLAKTLEVLVQATKQNPSSSPSPLVRSNSNNGSGSGSGKQSENTYKRKNQELAAEVNP